MRTCYFCFNEYEGLFCQNCRKRLSQSANMEHQLKTGTVLQEKYIIGHAISEGGFGIVYRAKDIVNNRVVAIKECYSSTVNSRESSGIVYNVSRNQKLRLVAEAALMKDYENNPNITDVYDSFETNGTQYIVMEFLPLTLNEYIQAHNMSDEEKCDLALDVANGVGNALRSMHKEKNYHCDIALDNIAVFEQNGKRVVKLMDFGASKFDDDDYENNMLVVKPGFSAPELYNGGEIGSWTDIYSLGAVLYTILTGKVWPEFGDNANEDVDTPRTKNSFVSKNFSNSIMKALEFAKELRFKNINDFLEAVNGKKEIKSVEKERKKNKNKLILSALAGCVALCLAIGYVFNFVYMEHDLSPATISVWYSVKENSTEEEAMQSIINDFMATYEYIEIEAQAIPETEYGERLKVAAEEGELPTLFESTDIEDSVLVNATDMKNVLNSPQARKSIFLRQYNKYYIDKKRVPLAIEIPMACIITNGATYLKYDSEYFYGLSDFGETTNIACDENCADMIEWNFDGYDFSPKNKFLNNTGNSSPVLISSTMEINEVRTELTNYEKMFVFYDAAEIKCKFTYEWSIGNGYEAEIKAAEALLSCMLGNAYQNTLMISKCSDGQIPINAKAFETKITNKNLTPIEGVYKNFVFERW